MAFTIPPLPPPDDTAAPRDLDALLQHLDMDLVTVHRHADVVLTALADAGRLEAVRLLLDAGVDDLWLPWTRLMTAAAIGSTDDLHRALAAGDALEDTDWRDRTPWLLAVHAGDIAKAQWLLDHGADVFAAGWAGRSALFHAIEAGRTGMLRWLLDLGLPLDTTDAGGQGPLAFAAELGGTAVAQVLLAHGAPVDEGTGHLNPLWLAQSASTVRLLLDHGADPNGLTAEGRRALLGLPPDADIGPLSAVTAAEFQRDGHRRFGVRHPTPMDEAIVHAMVRAGVCAWEAQQHFRTDRRDGQPTWCAQRFGQSLTFLPDGRIVQVGGEHEDGYDPDFCIYNDVIVHHPGGRLQVFGYPEDVFPPTDFHSATWVDGALWVIGGLGYAPARRLGETPVFRLDLATWRFERVTPTGPAPGWLYRHRASPAPDGAGLVVRGGSVLRARGDRDTWSPLVGTYRLDTRDRCWSRVD